jgi:general stress protein 26
MDYRSALDVLERVLGDSRVGVLATVRAEGGPAMRWMTPALVRGREGFLYAVTSPEFAKAHQIDANPSVEWMLQTKSLSDVVNVRGEIAIIDNPSAKADVLEALGGRLGTFWKLNPDESSLVVLEMQITSMTHFRPLTGEKSEYTVGVTDG